MAHLAPPPDAARPASPSPEDGGASSWRLPERPPVRVVVADDHLLVREGLVRLLEAHRGFQIVDAVPNGLDLLAAVGAHQPDVVLSDVEMPGRPFMELLRALRRRNEEVGILVVSGLRPELFAVRVLRAGANGYLRKDFDYRELYRAVEAVAGGRYYVPDPVSDLVLEALDPGSAPHHDLSDREFDVMRLLLEGLGEAAVARRLFLSERTVENHRTRLFARLAVGSVEELTEYAAAHGLVAGGRHP